MTPRFVHKLLSDMSVEPVLRLPVSDLVYANTGTAS
jgi:hypothetical protein